MSSLQQGTLNFNKNYSYNFEGSNLSSDAGLILIRSFAEKLELIPLLQKTPNNSVDRLHTYAEIIEQLVYSTIAGYPSDNCASMGIWGGAYEYGRLCENTLFMPRSDMIISHFQPIFVCF